MILKDDNLQDWKVDEKLIAYVFILHVQVIMYRGVLYGQIEVDITFTDDYPFDPPKVFICLTTLC